MPKNTKLSEREQGQIEALHSEGISFREIARRLGRSDHVVRNFCANPAKYDSVRGGGRPEILSIRDKRRIVKEASNSTKSSTAIRKDLNLNASKSTILRAINANPFIVRARMKPAPNLQPIHIARRLEFARTNMNMDWNLVRNLSFIS